MSITLLGRRPHLTPDELVEALVPPPHFREATFDTYRPDPDHSSQAAALKAASGFAARAAKSARRGRKRSRAEGLYLDGGFGVGKTHLLVSIAREVGDASAFGTFVEYTNLVGALGFAAAREALSGFAVLCIDEFELDDPGDTLLMARLMRELVEAGVAIAASSNTPPGALGNGRFAAEDFQREIQSLAGVFDVVRIDGPDYRHRHTDEFPAPASADAVVAVADDEDGAVVDFADLVADIAKVHPSRYGAFIDGLARLGLNDVTTLTDQSQALRLVTLVDRLYDRDVSIVASGVGFDEVFSEDMLRGGYRKKYLRAQSRLVAMTTGE
ncbi:cell division protein ZapE [Demequina aurantiaca]|uniref:cell division protein ZapE n=1 Tax=Demequina aurantiaca TaxID=676200 RepID=UPI0007824A9B|nr:cell division protein ZapE [Demequina aurantiaca]